MFKPTEEQVESFKWRVWNTFKSVIIPTVALILFTRLGETPNSLDQLLTKDLWEAIGYAVLISLLAGITAGADKTRRMSKDQ